MPPFDLTKLTPIGAGVSLIGALGNIFQQGENKRVLRGALKEIPEMAKQTALAQTLYNSRMPGAARMERNIYQTEANQLAGAQRAASSGSDLLLAGAGAAGQANQAFGQLGQMESQDAERRYQNLIAAQQADYAAAQQKFQNKMAIQGAIQANNPFTSLTNLGLGLANVGAASQNPWATINTGKTTGGTTGS
jgi:hypothetical protein